jgi:hypothetical protein
MEWWNGGMVEWWNGGMVEWWNGGMVEWWSGGVVEWGSGGENRWGWEINVPAGFLPLGSRYGWETRLLTSAATKRALCLWSGFGAFGLMAVFEG